MKRKCKHQKTYTKTHIRCKRDGSLRDVELHTLYCPYYEPTFLTKLLHCKNK